MRRPRRDGSSLQSFPVQVAPSLLPPPLPRASPILLVGDGRPCDGSSAAMRDRDLASATAARACGCAHRYQPKQHSQSSRTGELGSDFILIRDHLLTFVVVMKAALLLPARSQSATPRASRASPTTAFSLSRPTTPTSMSHVRCTCKANLFNNVVASCRMNLSE